MPAPTARKMPALHESAIFVRLILSTLPTLAPSRAEDEDTHG